MKILEEFAKNKVPQTFFELIIGGVDGRFLPKNMQDLSGETTQRTTVKNTVKTLELIKANSYITIPELAAALNKSKSAIEKQTVKLKENQQLERIGADKGGYWKIIKQTDNEIERST